MADEGNPVENKGFTINDGRWWLHEEDDGEDVQSEVRLKPPTVVEELETRLAEKDKLLQEYIQAHKSSVADMDEARMRLEKELDRRLEIEKARLVEPFLEISDNLQRLAVVCSHQDLGNEVQRGMELILKQVEDRFQKIGLQRIAIEGCKFDPKSMQALMTTEVEPEQNGMVLEEVQAGYTLNEHVVRPAGVRVGISKTDN